MDLLDELEGHLHGALAPLIEEGLFPVQAQGADFRASREQQRSDFTTALALGQAGPQSRLIAARLAASLALHSDFSAVEAVGAGFLNISLAPTVWSRMLARLLAEGSDYVSGSGSKAKANALELQPAAAACPDAERSARAQILCDTLARITRFADVLTEPSSSTNVAIGSLGPVHLVRVDGSVSVNLSLGELTSEIGAEAARFGLLMHRNNARAVLDAGVLTDFSSRNPVFWVQYAHARCCAIQDHAEAGLSFSESYDWNEGSDLDEGCRLILRQLALYPRRIDRVARTGEPCGLAQYVLNLAGLLHARYYRGIEAPNLRFIRDDDRLLTGARLAVVRGVETVLKSGLALLGVEAPREIR